MAKKSRKTVRYGAKSRAKRASRLFPELDKLPSPPPGVDAGCYRGLKVYARNDETRYGRCTGAHHNCTMESCRGHRIAVVWPEGHMTYPCGRGMIVFKDGWRIE